MTRRGTWVVAALALSTMGVAAQQNYLPDTTYAGTSLAGWTVVGDASWRAEGGEYIGTPTSPAGGWLMLDRSIQDVGVFGRFRCQNGCKTGILLRAERTPTGMKGIYVALTGETPGSYAVTLDAAGRETSREPLRAAGGQIRFAPPAPPTPAAPRAGGAGGRAGTPPDLPLTPPVGGLKPNDWNLVEILLDASLIRPYLNEVMIQSAAAEESLASFGPVALYIGSAGEVRYKDLATSDLALKTLPLEQVSSNFRMQQLHEYYYSWGGAVGDFNRDGVNDIAAGPYFYMGPDFTRFREIYAAQTINPSTEYPNDCMQNFADDVTGDGWADVMCMGAIGQDLHLYVNPKGEARRWTKIDVVPQVQKEVSLYADIDGDGRGEFIYGGGGFLRYAEPSATNPLGPWTVHDISTQGPWGAGHGLGVGDISGDGKVDVVDPYGWWEQPAGGAASGVWAYHPQAFAKWTGHASPGGGEIGVYDVNGDKLADVVAVQQAHGWGLNWYEQKRDASGRITWVAHMVMGDLGTTNAGKVAVSQMHGSTIADIDGDKIPDFIVGKRYWSHRDNYTDPFTYGPPVLYVYRTVRDPKAQGGARLVPELVHNRSGAGNAVTAADVNKDGVMDIVTSTNRGLFVFFGKPRSGASAAR